MTSGLGAPRSVEVGAFRGWVRGRVIDLPPGFLEDPVAALEGPHVRLLRAKKNTVVEVPGEPGWIVRRYIPRGLHSVVRNSVMVSKEANAFTFALEYERREIPTAPVLAFVERHENGIFRESILVTAKIPSTTLKERVLAADAEHAGRRNPGRGRRAWLRAFARFVRKAHAAGVYHGDLNGGNVLVPLDVTAPAEDAFVLIDVNRTAFGEPHEPKRVAADLAHVGGTPDERRFVLRCYVDDAKEYLRLRDKVLRLRSLKDTRKRLNRKLGLKKTLAAFKLK